jgi:hypothetical protein
MTSSQIKQRLLDRLDQLAEGEQRKILEFAENLPSVPKGTPGRDLVKFFGMIEPDDCRLMEEAVEAGCERIPA